MVTTGASVAGASEAAGASVAGASEAAGAEVSWLLLLSLPQAAATRASAAAATRPLLMLPIFLTLFLPLVLLLM